MNEHEMESLNAVEKKAATALLALAAGEHKYLTSTQAADGSTLSPIETSEVTDEAFDIWFRVELAGKELFFKYSLGYDGYTKLYCPAVEVSGGDGEAPAELDVRRIAGAPVPESGLVDAIDLLDNEVGEARFLAFQWIESIRPVANPQPSARG